MTDPRRLLVTYGKRVLAVALVAVLYAAARLPTVSVEERGALASRFHFDVVPLPTLHAASRYVRAVHPSLERIAAWISSVGASVALNDLDGDGLPNDVCYVFGTGATITSSVRTST